MQLEVGKYYRTRSGEKVGPILSNVGGFRPNKYPFGVGSDAPELRYCWKMDGRYGPVTDERDLVAEWVDEPAQPEWVEDYNAYDELDSCTAEVEYDRDGLYVRHRVTKRLEPVVEVRTFPLYWHNWGRSDLQLGAADIKMTLHNGKPVSVELA